MRERTLAVSALVEQMIFQQNEYIAKMAIQREKLSQLLRKVEQGQHIIKKKTMDDIDYLNRCFDSDS